MTSFERIYCLANVLRKDTTLAKLPSYQYYELLFNQLIIGKASFVYTCLKDLNNYTPYSVSEYFYKSDGVETQYVLSPIPSSSQTNIYVGIKNANDDLYRESLDYTYNSSTHTITFNEAPLLNSDVCVALFEIGSFNDTLDDDECAILAECMQIAYYEAFLGNSKSLNQVVYSSSVKIHSQAEQLKQLNNISINQWRDRVESMVIKYSYKRAKDKLKGLSGRGSNK